MTRTRKPKPTPTEQEYPYWKLSWTSLRTRHRTLVDTVVGGSDLNDSPLKSAWVLGSDPVVPPTPIMLTVEHIPHRKNPTVEDMPYYLGPGLLVSEPFKDVLVRFEPEVVRPYPVRFFGAPLPPGTPRFFVCDVTRIIECHDEARSELRFKESHGVRWGEFVGDMYVDPSRIPVGVHIARVKYKYTFVIVSDELRRALSGFTGCCFGPPESVLRW